MNKEVIKWDVRNAIINFIENDGPGDLDCGTFCITADNNDTDYVIVVEIFNNGSAHYADGRLRTDFFFRVKQVITANEDKLVTHMGALPIKEFYTRWKQY